MSEIKTFDGFEEGFSYCREVNAPVEVMIFGGKYKLFPSGRAERQFKFCPDCDRELLEKIPIPDHGTCPGCGTNWGRK